MVRIWYEDGMDVDFPTSIFPLNNWHDGVYVAARLQAVVWNDGGSKARNAAADS